MLFTDVEQINQNTLFFFNRRNIFRSGKKNGFGIKRFRDSFQISHLLDQDFSRLNGCLCRLYVIMKKNL